MIDSFLTIGSILFFILLTYAYQMRQRKYKKYATSCDVLYYPGKDKINMIDPKLYKSSPYKFNTTSNYRFVLEKKGIKEIRKIARNLGISRSIVNKYFNDKGKIIEYIVDAKGSELSDPISLMTEYPNETVFD